MFYKGIAGIESMQSMTYVFNWEKIVENLYQFMGREGIVDSDKKTVTIQIDHAYLQAIEIDSDDIIIDEVRESLLAWGNIELTLADYKALEQELRSRLEEKFDTAANGQAADELAVKMVKEVYEPIIKAIDHHYSVIVQFK